MTDAAERLRDRLARLVRGGVAFAGKEAEWDAALGADLDAALAAERRATVERIRAEVLKVPIMQPIRTVLAILDAEVVEHPVLDDNDR